MKDIGVLHWHMKLTLDISIGTALALERDSEGKESMWIDTPKRPGPLTSRA